MTRCGCVWECGARQSKFGVPCTLDCEYGSWRVDSAGDGDGWADHRYRWGGLHALGTVTASQLRWSGSPGVLTMGDSVKVDTCVLGSGVTMTQYASAAETVRQLDICALYMELDSGAAIDVTGKGYPCGIG